VLEKIKDVYGRLNVPTKIGIIISSMLILYILFFRTSGVDTDMTVGLSNGKTNSTNCDCKSCIRDEKSYAEYYRNRRILKGYTIEMLADSLKIQPRVLNMIEDGKATMMKDRWDKYEALLK
jgi:hypothetical protein